MREIPLQDGEGATVAHALVDDEDFFTLNTLCWHLGGGYAVHMFARWPASPFLLGMHRLLISPRGGFQVDHINGNRLDNRRSNLRLCTVRQNQWNRRCFRPDRKKGVTLDKRTGTWRVRLQHNGEKMSLGYYKSEDEAKAVYDSLAKKLRGEFFCA